MPLDPQVKAVMELIAAAGLPPNPALTPEEARRNMVVRSALTAGEPQQVAAVVDRWIPGPGGQLKVRAYAPAGTGTFPILVYFHGGGFVVGSVDTHDGLCRAITNASGCLVVSVDYRLAPEHPFPAAVQDAYAATQWAATHGAELNGDPTRLAVGGDSAGGNLAAVVAIMAREQGGPSLGYQLLIYPVTDYNFDTVTYTENGTGYMLSREDMEWYWHLYLASEVDGRHPHASPLRAEDLRGLAPALVITAEYDPLRDEGEAYAARLKGAGVPVVLSRYEGVTHNFVRLHPVLDQGKRAVEQIGTALREALRG